jgi:hypothetical protein
MKTFREDKRGAASAHAAKFCHPWSGDPAFQFDRHCIVGFIDCDA